MGGRVFWDTVLKVLSAGMWKSPKLMRYGIVSLCGPVGPGEHLLLVHLEGRRISRLSTFSAEL